MMTSSLVDLPFQINVEEHSESDVDQRCESFIKPSIAHNAFAHGKFVFGISPSHDSEHGWVASWSTSVAPYRAGHVASNSSGSIVAVSTDGGTISLLKGSDGTKLATRRVAAEGVREPARMMFCNDSTLLVEPPEGFPVLVSGINGDMLNSNDEQAVMEGARNISIRKIELLAADETQVPDVRALHGVIVNDNKIRLAVYDMEGNLGIFDHSNLNDSPDAIVENVFPDKDHGWTIDDLVGFKVQNTASNHPYLVFSAYGDGRFKVCWVDMVHLSQVCEYIPSPISSKYPVILDLEPTLSLPGDKTLSIAVATKLATDAMQATVSIVQVDKEETLGLCVIKNPHVLYTIDICERVNSIALSAVPDRLYGFLSRSAHDSNTCKCYFFHAKHSAIGEIRLLESRGMYKDAELLVERVGSPTLVNDKFARFYPSELHLGILRSIFEKWQLSSEEAQKQIELCKTVIIRGALTMFESAKSILVEACHLVLCPSSQVSDKTESSIDAYLKVLESWTTSLKEIANDASLQHESEMEELQNAFADKCVAIRQLHESTTCLTATCFDKFVLSQCTSTDLLHLFSSEGCFQEAKKLWESNAKSFLSLEALVQAVVKIDSKQDPYSFTDFLTDTVVPSLSISHELLPPILEWTCKIADEYDGDDLHDMGLSDSIFLLESVERSVKNLRLEVHESFAVRSPFVSGQRNGTLDKSFESSIAVDTSMETLSIALSKSDNAPGCGNEVPNPTLFELGSLKGGARSNNVSSLLADEINTLEDILETKLRNARCLLEARKHGLRRDRLTLADYESMGGDARVVDELIRLTSSPELDYMETKQRIEESVSFFCHKYDLSLDRGLLCYIRDLCAGERANESTIREASSLAQCCSTPQSRCEGILHLLRAALFCRVSPSWLSDLANQAISWAAGDSSIRAELEEAYRLLNIDAIVGRYCGNGAKKLFDVDNPRHAIRLLEFIASKKLERHILNDTIDLCNAFHHLSRDHAVQSLMQESILSQDAAAVGLLTEELCIRDTGLAVKTVSAAITFCEDNICDIFKHDESQKAEKPFTGHFFVECVGLILSTASKNDPKFLNNTLDNDDRTFARIKEQYIAIMHFLSEFSILIPAHLATNNSFVFMRSENLCKQIDFASTCNVARAKQACELLSCLSRIHYRSLWFLMIGASTCARIEIENPVNALNFLVSSSVTSESSSIASSSCLAAALSVSTAATERSSRNELDVAMNGVTIASYLAKMTTARCHVHYLLAAFNLGELTDTISSIFSLSDEGFGDAVDLCRRKAQLTIAGSTPSHQNVLELSNKIHFLHDSWYVGDGLLLNPMENLELGIGYCKSCFKIWAGRTELSRWTSIVDIHLFLEGRGAYAMDLRLQSTSIAIALSSAINTGIASEIADYCDQSMLLLAQRYVGSSGNGITSGFVDSQLSRSFLLCLPIKAAFKVYGSALPAAMSTQDTTRVLRLSSIGMATCGTNSHCHGSSSAVGWSDQVKFNEQCASLNCSSLWWKVLKSTGVSFDHRQLQRSGKTMNDIENRYASELLPSLISKLSTRLRQQEVIMVCGHYTAFFGGNLHVAAKHFLRFLLAGSEPCRLADQSQRRHLQAILNQLPGKEDRVTVLRETIRDWESSPSGHDYDRLSAIFEIYRAELISVIDDKRGTPTPISSLHRAYVKELDSIGRRLDVAAVLMAFFKDNNASSRPAFSKLFSPLPSDLGEPSANEGYHCSFLSSSSATPNNVCNPMDGVDIVLDADCDPHATKVLDSLCIPLGMPRGFIHARSLVRRFEKSCSKKATYPSFEADVVPAVERLYSAAHKCKLAEWASNQYELDSEERLKALDLALSCAIQASNEAEKLAGDNSQAGEDSVQNSLEDIRRISTRRDRYEDRMAVTAAIRGHREESNHTSLQELVRQFLTRLDECLWRSEEIVPEDLVKELISQASLLTADFCIDQNLALSMSQFRAFLRRVQRACVSITEKYSHVHVDSICSSMTRHWLLHGDHGVVSNDDGREVKKCPSGELYGGVDDDTTNFVMDLDDFKDSHGLAPCADADTEKLKLTASEEYSSILEGISPRERSEHQSKRAALRIAFVMSLAHVPTEKNDRKQYDDENSMELANTNVHRKKLQKTKRSRKGLLTRVGSKIESKKYEAIKEQSRSLLQVVFATGVSSDHLVQGLSQESNEQGLSQLSASAQSCRLTLTFAMRHRALRTAALLCPQPLLEKIIGDEGYISLGKGDVLKNCAYALFLCKEIEELGLPIPHSDLAQLITMHSVSYARTLWRHHRTTHNGKTSGRLLLLILELCLKEKHCDPVFVEKTFEQMYEVAPPRSTLLACECLVSYAKRFGMDSLFANLSSAIPLALRSLCKLIGMVGCDAKQWNGDNPSVTNCTVKTLSRIAAVLTCFEHAATGEKDQAIACFLRETVHLMDVFVAEQTHLAFLVLAVSKNCEKQLLPLLEECSQSAQAAIKDCQGSWGKRKRRFAEENTSTSDGTI